MKNKYLALSVLTVLIFLPFLAQAAGPSIFSTGVVPCGRAGQPMCTACDLFQLALNLLKLLWEGSVIVATCVFIWGGALLIFSGQNQNNLQKAKKMMTNTIVGIMIVFLAWLGIDYAIKLIGGKIVSSRTGRTVTKIGEFLPWNKVNCTISAVPTQTTLPPASGVIPYMSGAYAEADARTLVSANGININRSSCAPNQNTGCTSLEGIKRDSLQRLIDFNRECDGATGGGCDVVITGGTEDHSSGTYSHGNGYKLDIRSTPTIDFYITESGTFKKIGTRSDGAPLYSDSRGCTVYADERNIKGVSPHWDILYKPSPSSTPNNPYPSCN